MNLKKFLPLLPVLLLAGCSTNATFTRMTPTEQPRNADNLYPVEIAFNSGQQSLRWDSIRPYVIVHGQPFPLRPVPIVQNRWEGLVPVPPTASTVSYRFQVRLSLQQLRQRPATGQRMVAELYAEGH